MKKLISICVPCRNEVDNVKPLSEEIVKLLEQLPQYNFEIIFSDNCSTDGTQDQLREICSRDKRIKAILNAKNFPIGSGYNMIFQAQGDCIITLQADFQLPIELIPQSIVEWEKGAAVVAFLKKPGKHDKLRLFRKLYYKMSSLFSNQGNILRINGALYDRHFINICKRLNDPLFSLREMIVNYAAPLVTIEFDEKPRRSGKSNNSGFKLIDIAIKRFVLMSDTAPHYAILAGMGMGIVSFLISIYYLVRKLLDWYNFPLGIAPLIIGMFFLGGVQLIFIGLIGEYVMAINERQKNKPFVVEKERINFDDQPVEKQ